MLQNRSGDWGGLWFFWGCWFSTRVSGERAIMRVCYPKDGSDRQAGNTAHGCEIRTVHSVILFPFSFSSVSKRPSLLHASGPLTVGIGGVKPLDLSLLGVGDAAGDAAQLVFHVASAPSNGRLVLLARGKELLLREGDRFSCEDVRERRVRFVHSEDGAR